MRNRGLSRATVLAGLAVTVTLTQAALAGVRPVQTEPAGALTGALREQPRVAERSETSRDPDVHRQWGLAQIHGAEAWSRSTGAGVAIGVVDTGIDLDHEDLRGRVIAHTSCLGAEFTGSCGRGTAQDQHGHGTFVAGIAAASAGNGVGIAGVAPDAHLVVAKVLDRRMKGSVPDITAGIRWVVDHGAKVVNVSINDGGSSTASAAHALRGALAYAWDRGAIPVVAAGWSDFAATNAIVVASTTVSGELAPASGRLGTAKWGLVAPGGNPQTCGRRNPADCILSTSWSRGRVNDYTGAAGPSAAAPHVAGVVAQLLAAGYDQRSAVARVLESADRSRSCGPRCHGVVDSARALGVDVIATPIAEVVAPKSVPSGESPAPVAAVVASPAVARPAGARAAQSLALARALEPGSPVTPTIVVERVARVSNLALPPKPYGAIGPLAVLSMILLSATVTGFLRRRTLVVRHAFARP